MTAPLKVINRCSTARGVSTVDGIARRVGDRTDKLEVSFLPAALRWLPIGWGDYWVIGLAPDYRYAVVGEPSREYLWILSRTPTLATDDRRSIDAMLRERWIRSCEAREHATGRSLMARIFCIANQKGGVGKTTTAVNLAAALRIAGQRTLLVDLDPQGNATMGCGHRQARADASVYQVLLGMTRRRERAPTSPNTAASTCCPPTATWPEPRSTGRRGTPRARLKHALAKVDARVRLRADRLPAVAVMLTLNGLCAAHGVMIPMQCEYYALEGLSDLVNTIKQVHANLNPDLQIIGLLRVMFDPRSRSAQVSEQLEEHFGDKVFKAIIPRNVRLAEAPSYGLPGVNFDRAPRAPRLISNSPPR